MSGSSNLIPQEDHQLCHSGCDAPSNWNTKAFGSNSAVCLQGVPRSIMPSPPGQSPLPAPWIQRGYPIWRNWYANIHATSTVAAAMFDYHETVDEFGREEAIESGVVLEHMDMVTKIICSYGFDKRTQIMDKTLPHYPFVCEMDGAVFTDFRERNRKEYVNVYREHWMPWWCIAIEGDKGDVAALLRKPTLLFDDKEFNIGMVRRRAQNSGGFVVRRGKKTHKSVASGYWAASNPLTWPSIISNWGAELGLTGPGNQPLLPSSLASEMPRCIPPTATDRWVTLV